jgi:thiol-disulfide isomerase/thioredoxin
MKRIFLLLIFLLFAVSLNAQIKVESLDKHGLEKIVKERNGKVLLLNIWATWCVPCREEFPDLVKVANEYAKDKVEVIGISTDFPEDMKSKIIPFLKKKNVNFTNYISAFKNDEELINFIDKDWSGALPATVIYDQAGNKCAFLEGKKSYAHFTEQLNRLISE